eukprot:11119132-Lingulodinium_polyedra.AAC.1
MSPVPPSSLSRSISAEVPRQDSARAIDQSSVPGCRSRLFRWRWCSQRAPWRGRLREELWVVLGQVCGFARAVAASAWA